MLHDLWLRAKKRSDERSKKVWEFIKEIIKKIPPNNNNEYLVYYMQNEQIRAFCIHYDKHFKSYSLSHIDINFKTREEKLDFFLATELNFKMGQKLKELKRYESNLHLKVFEVFWSKVKRLLCEKFKHTKPPKCFALNIAGKKYLINSGDRFGNNYTFKLECEYNEQSI